jgi:Ca2+-binding EF-hand superfamily protein
MYTLVRFLDIREIKELREAFFTLDTLQTGRLTFTEIETALKSLGINPIQDEISKIFSSVTYAGEGEINYSDFLAATIRSKIKIGKEQMWFLFLCFDSD